MVSFKILAYLCFELEYIWFIFNDFLLSILHVFVVLDFLFDVIDFLLNRLETVSEEVKSIADVVIFTLFKFDQVLANMTLVEDAVAYLHLIILSYTF